MRVLRSAEIQQGQESSTAPRRPAIDIHGVVLLVLGLMMAVIVLSAFARRFDVSYPIILLLAGLLGGLIPQVPDVHLAPDIVFTVFLPPLLFSAAWNTSWREFRYNLVSISMLAIGLVAFTAIGVAFTAHLFLPGFDRETGFLLGAVVSTTDAVAASSIARKLGLPSSVIDTLDGESLLNDATGLLALSFGIQLITSGTTPTVGHGLLQFLWLLGGGALLGLLFGVVSSFLERFNDDGPISVALSFVLAYGTYLTAELVHASGVIAVVACGLFMSRRSARILSPDVRLQLAAVWDAIEFIFNGLIFILMGLQIPYVLAGIHSLTHRQAITYGLVFSALLIGLRMVWMLPSSTIAYTIRRHLLHQHCERADGRTVFLMGWTGMRGVVALAAASSLPFTLANGQPFPQRNLIVFLTYSVILVTLVFQGLTLAPIIRWMGFDDTDARNAGMEERTAREHILREAIGYVEGRRDAAGGDTHLFDDVLHTYNHRLEAVVGAGPERQLPTQTRDRLDLLLGSLAVEREHLQKLRASGHIGDELFRSIERELDLSESRILRVH